MPSAETPPAEDLAANLPEDVRWQIVLDGLAKPSYRARLHALRRIINEQRHTYRSREPVWDVVDKLEGYRFAASQGVPIPEVYGAWEHITQVPFDELPDTFVLKGTTGFYSHAVWALRRQPDGRYLNVLNQRKIRPADMITKMATLKEKGFIRGDQVFAEQLLDDGYGELRAATDWKLYCFYGEVGMIMARDTQGSLHREKMRFRYWDADWNDLGQANIDNIVDSTLPLPRHPDKLIEAAKLLSAATPRPHIRVDFYDTPESIYFGEYTLVPGGEHRLSPELDARLGQMWEAAEARLLHDFTRAGYLELGSPEKRRAQELLAPKGSRDHVDGATPVAATSTSVQAPIPRRKVKPTGRRLALASRLPWRRTARR